MKLEDLYNRPEGIYYLDELEFQSFVEELTKEETDNYFMQALLNAGEVLVNLQGGGQYLIKKAFRGSEEKGEKARLDL